MSKPKDIPNNRTNGDSISKSSHSNSILIFTLAVGIITFTYYFARSSISKTKKGISSDHKSTDDKNLNSSIDEVASQLTKLSKIKFSDPVQDNWIVASPNNIVDSVYVDNDPNKLKFVIADAVALRRPLQIKNYSSIRETWPIFNWDLLQIAREKNISLNGTRWKPDDPIFVLGHEREKGGMISSPRDHPLLYTNLTLFKFLKATFQPKNWLYWTGELASIEEQLQANATTSENADDMTDDGWRSFRILEKGISDGGKENAQLWNPMLWLSHPGVIAQTHYDTQHNFFIQIHGTKRFLIFPPSEELFQYPNIHRSYRQSQLHFEEKNDISRKLAFFSSQSGNSTEGSVVTEDSPTAAMNPLTYPVMEGKAEAIELLLHPGDILYIPPYWQHRVESLTLALSLSVLSPSHLEASLAEVSIVSVSLSNSFLNIVCNSNLDILGIRSFRGVSNFEGN